MDLLVKQDFAKVFAEFTPAMRAAMPEDRLRATWVALIAQVGAFKQQRGVRLETRGDMRVAIVTCDFERAAIDMQLAFNPAGVLGGWAMRPYAPPASYSPPPYADATKYTETDVTVGGVGLAASRHVDHAERTRAVCRRGARPRFRPERSR